MIRSVLLLIVGFGALLQGLMRVGKPAQTIEKSGWLYQQFGDQGIAYGMIIIGLIALLAGAIMFKNSWIKIIRLRYKK